MSEIVVAPPAMLGDVTVTLPGGVVLSVEGRQAPAPVVVQPPGVIGPSLYDLWLAEGHAGTLADFLATLAGGDGADGVGIAEVALVAGGLRVTLTSGAVLDLGRVLGEDGADGRGIQAVSTGGGRLSLTLTDGTLLDAGELPQGPEGDPGVGVTGAALDEAGHLRLTFSSGQTVDVGRVRGLDGEDGVPGVGVTAAAINSEGHLVLTLSDARTLDAGAARATDGEDGVSVIAASVVDGHLTLTLSSGQVLDAGPLPTAEGVAWDSVTDRPTEFPPADHEHEIAGVAGLTEALAGKAATADVTALDGRLESVKAALPEKASTTDLAALTGRVSTLESTRLDLEAVQDAVAAMFGTVGSYNDTAGTYTITLPQPRTDEEIQDVVAALIAAGANVTKTYDDAGNVLTLSVTATTGGSSTLQRSPVTLGLTAEYDFLKGASATTLYDVSGNARNGTITGAVLWADGGGLRMEGGYVTFGTSLGGLSLYAAAGQAWSVFLRVAAPISTGGSANLITRAGAGTTETRTFQIFLTTPTAATVNVRGVSSTLPLPGDVPLTIGFVWDGSSLTVWTGGSLATQILGTGTAAEETTQNIMLGARAAGANTSGLANPLTAYHLAAYDRALTRAEAFNVCMFLDNIK